MDKNLSDTFVEKFLKELREDNAAVFIGAGLSRGAGYVDWAGLLAPLAAELGLDTAREEDLVGVAQFYLNSHKDNRNQLNQQLLDAFSDLKVPTENHRILARLPVRTYWTTNYDRLIEKAIDEAGKKVDSKYTVAQLANTRRGRDVVLFKMHGDIEHPAEAVLTRDDYESYHLSNSRGPFVTALSGDLVEKTFLFLGFSFTDPNLNYILSRIRVAFTKHQRQHYCIMKKRMQLNGESEDDFKYAAIKQGLMIQDLERFNIRTLLVDDYSEITALLSKIERRFRLSTVFVSGSAADYGKWGREGAERFLSALSSELIRRDFRITTGFGLGVGGSIVTGAVQEIYSSPHRSIEEQLVMRPFPIAMTNESERVPTYDRYREELLGQSGIAIFVFGNKAENGKVVEADGVKAEFDKAVAKGLIPVPVGASGFVAESLWRTVLSDPDKYYKSDLEKITPLLEALGSSAGDPVELVKPLTNLIEILTKG